MTSLNMPRNLIGSQYEAGALISYLGTPSTIELRVGVSFVSADQACANIDEELGNSTFTEIENQSKALWNQKLGRVELDLAGTPTNITEMFYSSFYRSFLTPVSTLNPRKWFHMLTECRTTLLERRSTSSPGRRTRTLTPCECTWPAYAPSAD
jgi:putative alpha-1,2-mannosidase